MPRDLIDVLTAAALLGGMFWPAPGLVAQTQGACLVEELPGADAAAVALLWENGSAARGWLPPGAAALVAQARLERARRAAPDVVATLHVDDELSAIVGAAPAANGAALAAFCRALLADELPVDDETLAVAIGRAALQADDLQFLVPSGVLMAAARAELGAFAGPLLGDSRAMAATTPDELRELLRWRVGVSGALRGALTPELRAAAAGIASRNEPPPPPPPPRGSPAAGSASAASAAPPAGAMPSAQAPSASTRSAMGPSASTASAAAPSAAGPSTAGGASPSPGAATAATGAVPHPAPTPTAGAGAAGVPALRTAVHARIDQPFVMVAFAAPDGAERAAFAVACEVLRARAARRWRLHGTESFAGTPSVAWSWLHGDAFARVHRRGRDVFRLLPGEDAADVHEELAATRAEVAALLHDLQHDPPTAAEVSKACTDLALELGLAPAARASGDAAVLAPRLLAALLAARRGVDAAALAEVTAAAVQRTLVACFAPAAARWHALLPEPRAGYGWRRR